jgi:hypothetical protein
MTLQFLIVLALALLCVAYFLKDLLRSAVRGGCGSGCGGCKTGGCPVKKLEAVQSGLDKPRQHSHSA